jgi:hypothetical protein
MAKKKTSLEQKIDALTTIVEKGFAAVAGNITDIKRDMATKEQVIAVHTQVNSIERQLRETRNELRLGNLEDKVFGASRASSFPPATITRPTAELLLEVALYWGFTGAPGTTAGTASGLMLKAKNVKGASPGFPHWWTSPNGS